MKDAGCWAILFGAESGVQKHLNTLRKGSTLQHTRDAVKAAKQVGLSVTTSFMFGIPGETYADAIQFFNQYAAESKPQSAKGAFCALRRGLDASDTNAFPENVFGTAEKSNTQRYIDIASSFSEYGANQGDPEKAIGGGMINRKRMDYNDVGWKILTTNYQRHLTQIDPEETRGNCGCRFRIAARDAVAG